MYLYILVFVKDDIGTHSILFFSAIGLACLYVVLFAMAYEALKLFRDYIYSVEKRHRARKSQGSANATLIIRYDLQNNNSIYTTHISTYVHVKYIGLVY